MDNGNIETLFMITKSLGWALLQFLNITKKLTVNSIIGSSVITGYLIESFKNFTAKDADSVKRKSTINFDFKIYLHNIELNLNFRKTIE